ncbi:MAG: hypothetical protein RIF41_03885 [Polyangiaceae bacterium]
MTDDAALHARIRGLEEELAALHQAIHEARSMMADDAGGDRLSEGTPVITPWEPGVVDRRYLEQRAGMTLGALILIAFGLLLTGLSVHLMVSMIRFGAT